MEEGYIYCLSNKSLKDTVKVGFTTKIPCQRAKQLSNTSIPTPFILNFYAKFEDVKKYEKMIHNKIVELGYERINSGREFFKCSSVDIKNIFEKIYNKEIIYNNEEEKSLYENVPLLPIKLKGFKKI